MAEQADVIYAIILANIGQAVLLLFVGLVLLPLLAAIVRVPRSILGPSVLVMASFGCFGITGDLVGPTTLLIFSALGFLLRKYQYSVAAAVIGMLLGGMAESELLRSFQISGGELFLRIGATHYLGFAGPAHWFSVCTRDSGEAQVTFSGDSREPGLKWPESVTHTVRKDIDYYHAGNDQPHSQ